MLSKETITKNLVGGEKYTVETYDEVTSTNELVKERAKMGADEGLVIVAERQSAGKGRVGKEFFSPDGGLYMSVLLKPEILPEDAYLITAAAAVATAQAIESVSLHEAEIKWVNDIFIGDKKVSGILTEASLDESEDIKYAVLGIGVNVFAPKEGFPEDIAQKVCAVSDGDAPLMRERIAAEIINRFFAIYRDFNDRDFLSEYRRRLFVIGMNVGIVGREGRFFIEDMDERCRLKVIDESGNAEYIDSGEISILI